MRVFDDRGRVLMLDSVTLGDTGHNWWTASSQRQLVADPRCTLTGGCPRGDHELGVIHGWVSGKGACDVGHGELRLSKTETRKHRGTFRWGKGFQRTRAGCRMCSRAAAGGTRLLRLPPGDSGGSGPRGGVRQAPEITVEFLVVETFLPSVPHVSVVTKH
jgi:hypothetical protein